MIRVYVARQRYDAYLVADRLNQAGIRAHVFNEHASSIVGDVPPDVAQPQVWIADDRDAPRADAHRAALLPQMRRAIAGQFRALLELRHGDRLSFVETGIDPAIHADERRVRRAMPMS
jgi:hypothetical protein